MTKKLFVSFSPDEVEKKIIQVKKEVFDNDIKNLLEDIFKEHTLVLVDVSKYDTKPPKIPTDRIVSYKWLANSMRKRHLSTSKKGRN